jgi:spectinomycin phosphotransferase/16S rRNA (guanine(1405)-N(7))-methyltransferase
VLSRPGDLTDDALARALHQGWGVDVASIEYLPVGFGSHHWAVVDGNGTEWFVTVDEHPPLESLCSALATAVALRRAGLTFVVAPVPTSAAEPQLVLGNFVVACYPYIDGESFAWDAAPPDFGDAILRMLVAVHLTDVRARADDFVIPHRDSLLDTDIPRTGPYSGPTAALLGERAPVIRGALARYDALVERADEQPSRVVTHGEPHPGNAMRTANGWMLVDWDTVLVAPPERDLWDLGPLQRAYENLTGIALHPSMLELYRLGWYLKDLAVYVERFRGPHNGNADDVKSWHGVSESLAGL